MATSIDVNVKLVSLIGATQTGGSIRSARPFVQTTASMNGEIPDFIVPDIPLLSVNPLDPFETYANTTSTQQDVILTNIGNAVLTVTNLTFSLRGGIRPMFYWATDAALYNTVTNSSSTITILPGTSKTFKMAYIGTEVGEQSNSLTFFSNSVTGDYKINTIQNILPDADNFYLTPSGFTYEVTELGLPVSTTISLNPTINGLDDPSFPVLNFTTSIEGSPGWYVSSTSSNSLALTFDPDYVNNINSATGYVSTLTVTAGGNQRTFTTTATINLTGEYRNLSTWVSPTANNNSIIGISFDIFNDIKIVTIGVGAGGDGSPIYSQGGDKFVNIENLSIGSATIDSPYPYWSTVYSIPLSEKGSYLSGALDANDLPAYIKKTTDGLNYDQYFGYEQSQGSMFVVEYDGYSNVNININNLRELSGDIEFDATMENLTRAFHYYSEQDIPGRINNLPQYPLSISTSTSTTVLPVGETRTKLFRGFVATSFDPETWIIDTSIVPFPS